MKKIAQKIILHAKRKKISISICESCTGGKISDALTQIPGASKVFLGGVIAYSPTAKEKLLKIKKKKLASFKSVSLYTSYLLAASIKTQLKSGISLAITGFLGPSGGTKKNPKGTICIAVISNRLTITKKIKFKSKLRIKNKTGAARLALKLLEYTLRAY